MNLQPPIPSRPTTTGSSANGNNTISDDSTVVARPSTRGVRQSRFIEDLVRQSSLELIRDSSLGNPFTSADPTFDPTSRHFSAKAWLKALLHGTASCPEKYPQHSIGVSFRDLVVSVEGGGPLYQDDILSWPLRFPRMLVERVKGSRPRTRILTDLDGLVRSGEMLLVLGRPESGVSTLLRAIAGELESAEIESESCINYGGISYKAMRKFFRGETIYQAEEDIHFPLLNVGYTLEFAASLRTPKNRFPGVSRGAYAKHLRDVVMAMYGISHTASTKVGNDLIRGVSGGERKRVSIAEVTLSQSAVQCWDNSTKGLDAATAVDFTNSLRLSTELTESTTVAAMHQAAEASFNTFDKVTLLYEGKQIYFGPVHHAKTYFIEMGYHCPDRQTTADFLTSITNPAERIVREGFEKLVPRTAGDFATAWKNNMAYNQLLREIKAFEQKYPLDGEQVDKFLEVRGVRQSWLQRSKSPYTVSVLLQIWLCIIRGFHRLRHDMVFFTFIVAQNMATGLIIGSLFYNLPETAEGIADRLVLLFFAVLFNAMAASFEIIPLYSHRPIVSKHRRYALYHPVCDAIASVITELPSKAFSSIALNLPLYFLSNLRRELTPFLTFILFGLASTLVISKVLRTLGHVTRSMYQALAPYTLIVIMMIIYTGFILPERMMQGWLRWLVHLNPISYSYQSIVINELSGRRFECTSFVPAYVGVDGERRACATPGAALGESFVDGDEYIRSQLGYDIDKLWRNFFTLLCFICGISTIYFLAVEYIDVDRVQTGSMLLLNDQKDLRAERRESDEESLSSFNTRNYAISYDIPSTSDGIQAPKSSDGSLGSDQTQWGSSHRDTKIFQWQNICYDVDVEGESRRILDDVFGWVKPGSLTALMGATGAGKTTLLDVLADRISVGVVSGDITINGSPRTPGFQSHTGYARQQDVHLPTTTVREALRFSALLRQREVSTEEEKFAYVEEIISTLGLEQYANALVGEAGRGLNAEQLKRLTIGVELAAKPDLLLFLDEPTSGLDSQTAWSICNLLRKLADQGQAILCTIHQPSALLFQQFDRMLLLGKGGKMLYFGDIGEDSRTMIDYFEKHGAPSCGPDANPAEWVLDVTRTHTSGRSGSLGMMANWARVWKESDERVERLNEVGGYKGYFEGFERPSLRESSYATSFLTQLWYTLVRIFQQYYRTPSYIWSKFILVGGVSLAVGLSFQGVDLSLQGVASQRFSVFMILTTLVFLAYQTMPHFVIQRSVFEARERASRTYSWCVFILSNIIVELPWTFVSAVLMFVTWYYPIGMNENAGPGESAERSGLVFLLLWAFMLFTTTFTHMVIVAINSAELGALTGLTLYTSCLVFCGIIRVRIALPGFWSFMYRVSPLTYLVGGLLAGGISGREIQCSNLELLRFHPPENSTCGQYMLEHIQQFGGRLLDESLRDNCEYCSLATTDAYLDTMEIYYDKRWRNLGFQFGYILFNIAAAMGIYWVARVPKSKIWFQR